LQPVAHPPYSRPSSDNRYLHPAKHHSLASSWILSGELGLLTTSWETRSQTTLRRVRPFRPHTFRTKQLSVAI
jgi:hypothetical protein